MRIQLKISSNTQPVPFDYQQKLVGTIHKWIGKNDLHGEVSLYSFSWLNNGSVRNNHLEFKNGSSMFLSFYDVNAIKQIIRSILDSPEMFCGMEVYEVNMVSDPDMTSRTTFSCASPIFIKRRMEDGNLKHFTFNDIESSELLKQSLLTKMRLAGMEEDETLEIHFDTSYPKKRIKLVHYHGIGNKASLCPVIIKGKPETKLFAWNVGIGNCSGIGFGAIF